VTTNDERDWFAAIPRWSRAQRRIAVAFGVSFVLLIASSPLLWLLAPPALTMASVPAPTWSGSGFRSGELMRAWERYFKESSWLTFLLRGMRNEVAWSLGMLEPADVVLGRDRWLFLRHTVTWDAGELTRSAARRRAVLAEAKAWADARGIRLLVLPAPDKSTIYPEQLLPGALPAERAKLYDTILADLAAVGLPALDVRAVLTTAKRTAGSERLYFAGDTHWTQLAKQAVAAAVARHLAAQPGIVLPPAPNLVVDSPHSEPFVPDLVRMLGFRIREGQPVDTVPAHLREFVEFRASRKAHFVNEGVGREVEPRQDGAAVALCGSSYSGDFAAELMAALHTVVDARGALAGGGSFRGIRTVMLASGQNGFAPRVVLWEFVEREYLAEWLRVDSLQPK
jgi:hypothetical protein